MGGDGLARRYIQPLFDVAQEKGELEKITSDLAQLDEILAQSTELRGLLADPSVERSTKRSVVEEIFKDASMYTLNFMRLVIDKNRTGLFRIAYRIFRELIDKSEGITTGQVESAIPLSDEVFEKVKTGLESRFNYKLELERVVIPELIAGLRVRIGNLVIDGSLHGRLERLRSILAGE